MLRKIILGVIAVPIVALSGGVVASAAPADNEGVASTVQADPRPEPLTCRNGRVQIGYSGVRFTESDWYALYYGAPNSSDWTSGLVGSNWQWASVARVYLTNQTSGWFTSAYWTYNYDVGTYQLVRNTTAEYIDCNS